MMLKVLKLQPHITFGSYNNNNIFYSSKNNNNNNINNLINVYPFSRVHTLYLFLDLICSPEQECFVILLF